MTLAELKRLRRLRMRNIAETELLIAANPGVPMFTDQLSDLADEVACLDAQIAALEPPPIFIGVDPAMDASGWAIRLPGSNIAWHIVRGVENLHKAVEAFAVLAQPWPASKIVLCVEYPTWRGKGTDATRAAANCWIRAIKAAFPRRVTVLKVTPQTWMAAMIPGWRRASPSILYQQAAARLLGSCDPHLPDDAAAAVCILAYAESGASSNKKARAGNAWAMEVTD